MLKWSRVIVVVLLATLVGYGILISGYRINSELSAVKYRLGDEENYENISIMINGTYHKRLFSSDIFKGTIYIEGFEFTNEKSGFVNMKSTLADIQFDKNGHGYYKYVKAVDGNLHYLMRGSIFIKDRFSMLTMTIMESYIDEPGSGLNDQIGLMISAPAETRTQALSTSNLLLKANHK